MKLVHVFATPDGESHFELSALEWIDGRRTEALAAKSVMFINRAPNEFLDFHPVGNPQYVLYLTVKVEIGLSDGTSVILEPGDVMHVEDTHGKGHTSRVLEPGVCVFVPFA